MSICEETISDEVKDHCQPAKMIYCLMARGHAESVVQELYQQKHILGIDYITGRNQDANMGPNEWQEVDILIAIVSPEFADEIFYQMYYLAKIYETEGGVIYQVDLDVSTNYELPDLTELVDSDVSLEEDVPK